MPDEDYPEVDQILQSKTLYEVLSVEKTSSAAEIKDGFRKLARKVHPDRCKHSKATEAFQKIQHAYEILSDEKKRSDYDMYGDNPTPQPQQFYNGNGARYYYTNGGNTYYTFEDDISPDDILRMFFGDFNRPYGNQRYYQNNQNAYYQNQRRRQYAQQPQEEVPFYRHPFFLQFVVAILFMILMVFSNTYSNNSNIDWQNLIQFNLDGSKRQNDYIHLKSKQYRIPFDLPKSKTNEIIRKNDFSTSAFYERARNVADELFVDTVKTGCRQEKMRNVYDGKYCRLMREYRVR